MPVEIKELKIKVVINMQPAMQQVQQSVISQAQLDKWKKEITGEVINKLKEYLKEQTER